MLTATEARNIVNKVSSDKTEEIVELIKKEALLGKNVLYLSKSYGTKEYTNLINLGFDVREVPLIAYKIIKW